MYSVFFQFRAEPAFRQNVIDTLIQDARASERREPGTLRFDVIEDEHRPNDLYVYAVYRDRDAFDEHFTGPNFRRWHDITDERWLASPVVVLGRGTILESVSDDAAGPTGAIVAPPAPRSSSETPESHAT